MAIEAEWPEEMKVGQSDWIRISFIRTTGQIYIATVESTKHTAILATSKPIGGTPAVSIEESFGPEYEACAIANLEGEAFDIGELTTGCQSLEQPEITWEWNIKPKNDEVVGLQIINARIEAQWKPTGNSDTIIQRQIWRSRFEIEVNRSLVNWVNSLFIGLVGSVFSAPWLYDKYKEWREKQEKAKASKPKIYLPSDDK